MIAMRPSGKTSAGADAGFWLRLGARLLDAAIFAPLDIIFVGLAAWLNALGQPAWVLAVGFVAARPLWYLYLFEFTRRSGQTVGKNLAAIQVVGPDGRPPTAPVMARRLVVELAFDLAGLPLMLAGWLVARHLSLAGQFAATAVVIGFGAGTVVSAINPLWIFISPRRQALHDLAAGTFVLRTAGDRVGAFAFVAVVAALLPDAMVMGVARPFLVQAYVVPSGSMEPTIEEGDRILSNNLVHRLRPPRRREIIMFRAPDYVASEPVTFVKRVVGVAGDRLQVRDGKLFVNGEPQAEPYTKEPMLYTWPDGAKKGATVTVPSGTVVVMGDNRNDSHDSHRWERVSAESHAVEPAPGLPLDTLRGNLVFRFWPPDRIGTVVQK
jgi:signal peptidase I